jgi:4-hydroxyphenylacetate 3-monooxygenase
MGARTGQQYKERLAATSPTIQIGGETVSRDIPSHPAFKNIVNTYARLYDLQHRPELKDVMTYTSPTTGDPVGTSFMVPRTKEDLVKRREAMAVWARDANGMLGRTGDYMNASLMALSEAGPWFAQADKGFGENIKKYYEKVREEDLLMTHTLIPPRANRSQTTQTGGELAARIVKEDDNGIVVRGARMLATIGPFSDELLVFPSTILKGTPEDEPFSFAFAISSDHPGLSYICRDTMDQNRSHFDHPLGSRYEEMDAVVVFDDVHVPYERCFMIGNPELANGFYNDTSAVVHMTHQVTTRTTAKTEFLLGLITCMAETLGSDGFPHVQADIADVAIAVETLHALVQSAEAGATLNEYGVMTPQWLPLNACRNWYPKYSQNFPEMIRRLGSSGLMALPTEADINGPAADDIDTYLRSSTLDGGDRVKLFRLAWDVAISAFGGRQNLYEYFFFGDPVKMSGAFVKTLDNTPYQDRVWELLNREDD